MFINYPQLAIRNLHSGLLLLWITSVGAPATDPRALLYDFEEGTLNWKASAWGAGKARAVIGAGARFGKGALRLTYEATTNGASVIAPYFAEGASWRGKPWGGLSFWARCLEEGSHKVSLQIETGQQGTGFSANFTLHGKTWQRYEATTASVWSREGLRIEWGAMRRFYFISYASAVFEVDQMVLEPIAREVPLDVLPAGFCSRLTNASTLPAPVGPQPKLLELDYGEYAVRWAPPEGLRSARLATCIHALGEGGPWEVSQTITTERASVEEPLIRLSSRPTSRAEACWHFSAMDETGRLLASASGRFQVFPPEPVRPKPLLALLPQPKNLRAGQGRWLLPAQARIVPIGFLPEELGKITDALAEPLHKYYGLSCTPGEVGDITLLLAGKPEQLPAHFPPDRAQAFASLPEDGYLLEVTERGMAIAGKSPRGIFYGVQTFLQAVGLSTLLGEPPSCPALSVCDFPSLSVRAVSVGFPNDRWGHPNDAPFKPEWLEDYLDRVVVRHKLNTLVLIVNQAIRLDSHPELAAPQAWTKEQLRQVLEFARRHYLEVVPLVTILGHADWFTLDYQDLREEGDNLIACTSNPKTQQILTEVVTEVADLFQPRRFHLGMDEAWWRTLDLPEAKRCKLCAVRSKSEIFASHLLRYHALLKARGIETMIWGDMLLPEHNGGAPYDTAKALERIPRDLILCNWSTSYVPLSSKRFRDLGFRVIQSNSADINRQQGCWVIGNMMGCWNKSPWLVLTTTDLQEFSYLPVVQSAERGWNPNPDLQNEACALSREFLDQSAREALALIARPPAPMATGPDQPISLSGMANLSTTAVTPPKPEAWFGLAPADSVMDLPVGKVIVGGLPFMLLPAAVSNAVVFATRPVTIPLRAKAGALAFLYGCHVPPERKAGFRERFKEKESILGVLIGTLRICYSDGTVAEFEIRYGLNVLEWKPGDKLLPYVYGASGFLGASTAGHPARDARRRDAFFYAACWGNPHPGKEIARMELVAAGTEAVPFLLGLTAWATR